MIVDKFDEKKKKKIRVIVLGENLVVVCFLYDEKEKVKKVFFVVS